MNFSKKFDWPFENPRWRPVFKMVAILHLKIEVGIKKIINSTDLNDLGVLPLYV